VNRDSGTASANGGLVQPVRFSDGIVVKHLHGLWTKSMPLVLSCKGFVKSLWRFNNGDFYDNADDASIGPFPAQPEAEAA